MVFEYNVIGFYLSILGILLTISVPFFYVQYTIKSQYRENYNTALKKMLEEMKSNSRKMHNFNNNFAIVLNQWRDRNNSLPAYLPKTPSFGSHNFILHYAPSKAFYNFINRGYFLRLDDGRLEHLMEFYIRCIHFSDNTPPIEVAINNMNKNSVEFEDNLMTYIQQINAQYSEHTHGLDYHYDAFNPDNLDGLEISHWYNV